MRSPEASQDPPWRACATWTRHDDDNEADILHRNGFGALLEIPFEATFKADDTNVG